MSLLYNFKCKDCGFKTFGSVSLTLPQMLSNPLPSDYWTCECPKCGSKNVWGEYPRELFSKKNLKRTLAQDGVVAKAKMGF